MPRSVLLMLIPIMAVFLYLVFVEIPQKHPTDHTISGGFYSAKPSGGLDSNLVDPTKISFRVKQISPEEWAYEMRYSSTPGDTSVYRLEKSPDGRGIVLNENFDK